MDGSESVRLLLKKQHPVKRQPHSATTLKKWRGEESPSVLRRRGCQRTGKGLGKKRAGFVTVELY
jgi:hypothetical protein